MIPFSLKKTIFLLVSLTFYFNAFASPTFKFRNYTFGKGVPTGNYIAMKNSVNCFEEPNTHDCWYENYISSTRFNAWNPDPRRAVRSFIKSGSCLLPVTVSGTRHATICPANALEHTSHVAQILFGSNYRQYCMENCGKQLKKAAATTGWISHVAKVYHHYLMSELANELKKNIIWLKYGVTPEFKEEANAVMEGLKACMKDELSYEEPAEAGIRDCYNTFRRAMEELME